MATYTEIEPDILQVEETLMDGTRKSRILIKRLGLWETPAGEEVDLTGETITALDVPAWEAARDAALAAHLFRKYKHESMKAQVVFVGGKPFTATNEAIRLMTERVASLTGKPSSEAVKWQLDNSNDGVMTSITAGELRTAQRIAVEQKMDIYDFSLYVP